MDLTGGEALLDGARVRVWPLRPARRAVARMALDATRASVRCAEVGDVAEMVALMEAFVRRGLLLPRDESQVYRHFREFVVAEVGGRIVGCAGLRVYSQKSAEIVALAVDEAAHGQGVGRRMVAELIERARAMGIARVFALTLEEGFFARLGFRRVDVAEFPEKIAADCAGCAKRACCVEVAVALDLAV